MNQIKLKKIASQIIKEVSEIILSESRDTVIKSITITDCEVSNDLGFAKIYFTSLVDKELILQELKEASGFIRSKLANRIDIRHIPKLIFLYDESISYGNKIEEIIHRIHENDETI